jgi:hypothetical protein
MLSPSLLRLRDLRRAAAADLADFHSVSGLEQLDRIAVGIFQLDLFAARANLQLIAKMQAGLPEGIDTSRKIAHLKNNSIPAAWLLATTVRHGARAGSTRAAENQFQIADRYLSESRQVLVLQLKPHLLRVEVDRATDILDLISDAPQA